MWLPWTYSLPLAGLFLSLGGLARATRATRATGERRAVVAARLATSAAVAFEAARVALLYTLWQVAGRLSVAGIERANDRGQWLWDLERNLHLPDEAALQALILPHSWLVQGANLYYGGAHVPGMGIFLLWMFVHHRPAYPAWRNVLVAITFVSLVIQLLPVAPPRLLPNLGMIDTGVAYGQSVYALGGSTVAGQLQAMPSLHVGWAALITLATWRHGGPAARTAGLAHGLLTFLVVAVTANHYWLDGVACVALLVPCVLALTRVGATPGPPSLTEPALRSGPDSDPDYVGAHG